MPHRFDGRLRRLEQQAPETAWLHSGGDPAPAYVYPEPPAAWFAEVFRLLLESGHGEAVLGSWGVPKHAIGPMAAAMTEDYPHGLTL